MPFLGSAHGAVSYGRARRGASWVNGGVVTTLAGSGSASFADGTGTNASFRYPMGVAVIPSSGAIVVADTFNNRIRLVNPTSGVVTTLAGNSQGSADGTGTGASFYYPISVAVIPSSELFVVADTFNNRIRLVNPTSGVVTTLAGSGNYDFADGTGTGASFRRPGAVAVASTGDIIVSDSDNHRIRLVTLAGVVTTLAGSGNYDFADGTGASASFRLPRGLAVISTGVIVVADAENNRIRLVTLAGVVTTLAGSSGGFADGTGTGATFASPTGVAITSSGVLVVSEQGNHRIRLVTYPGGVVTTFAGSGSPAFADGTGVAASFNQPFSVAVTSSGLIVVADHYNHRIRLIT